VKARNQLTALSGPGLTASFQYDGLGRRKQKTINGTTTAFLYDGLNIVQELFGTPPTANLLTRLDIDEVLQRTEAAGTRLVLTDGLGSTLALVDSAGTLQTQYAYEPFGQTTVSGATSTNAVQYTGREDDGTGLYYYRARYYDSNLQRFTAEDPIGFAGGETNLYGYVHNDPINQVDPWGLIPKNLAQWCQKLLEHIRKLDEVIANKKDDIDRNEGPRGGSGPLPEFCPDGKPRDSVQGHRDLLKEAEDVRDQLQQQYDYLCTGRFPLT
jgi:RHS repeat-associated protein